MSIALQANRASCPLAGALLAVDASGMVLGFTGTTTLNSVGSKHFEARKRFRGWRSAVSDQQYSDLVEIAKRNGDFRKNYGPFIGAFLYLRSINAARPRSLWWSGLLVTLASSAIALLQKYGWPIHG